MGLYESAAGPRIQSRAIGYDLGIGRVLGRFVEWGRELPGLVRGLYALAKPFRWHLLVMLGFNLLIAGWETIQPLILAWSVDTFAEDAPYLEIMAIIIYPVLVVALPHGIVLPLLRDLYCVRFIRPQFEKHVGLVCLKRDLSPERSTDPELLGRRAPIVQEGRGAAFVLIDMTLRDPAFALRGIVVMGVLAFLSPPLVGLLLLGMVLDMWITLLMDVRLFTPYQVQKEHQFRVRGMEFDLFDGPGRGEDGELSALEYGKCEREWDRYVYATRYAEIRRMIYQLPIREAVSTVVRIGCMLLVAWWVHTDQVSIGEYIFFVQLAGRANDPLYVFFGFQNQIMVNRESLRRLGLLAGIDFGLSRTSASATASAAARAPAPAVT